MNEENSNPAGENRSAHLTDLLEKWRNGTSVRNRDITDQLLPLIYEDLVKIAQKGAFSQSVDARELVHELFVKWEEGARLPKSWKNRAHFYATARIAMRNLMIDGHRRRKSSVNVTLDDNFSTLDLLLVDEMLEEIGKTTPRFEEVLLYKLVYGCTDEETAEALGVSESTAKRQFSAAKGKLREKLKDRLVR